MNRAILVIIFLSALNSFAQQRDCSLQKDSLTSEMIVFLPDHAAEPIGGLHGLGKEISKSVKYPNTNNAEIDSKIFVVFIVDASGNVKGERILKGMPEIAAQLLNVVKRMSW